MAIDVKEGPHKPKYKPKPPLRQSSSSTSNYLPLQIKTKGPAPRASWSGRRGFDHPPSAPTLIHRNPISLTQTQGWTPLGCYIDSSTAQILTVDKAAKITNGTVERCQEECYSAGYGYCGVEYGIQCWCGLTAPSDSQKEFANGIMTGTSGCDKPVATPCPGNPSELCGAGNRTDVYFFGLKPTSSSTPSTTVSSSTPSFPVIPSLTDSSTPIVPTPTLPSDLPSMPDVSGSDANDSDASSANIYGSDTSGSNTNSPSTGGSNTDDSNTEWLQRRQSRHS